MSVSNISGRLWKLMNEAQDTITMGKVLGLVFERWEAKAINKIIQMEEDDEARLVGEMKKGSV